MNVFLILYLIGCATALVQLVAGICIGFQKESKDIVVGDIFQMVCAILASWVFVVAYIVCDYPKIWNKVIIKSKQKKK